MFTVEASVETDRASRYLTQLCEHLRQVQPHDGLFLHGRHRPPELQHVEWTETAGAMRFENGTCALEAHGDVLLIRLTARDETSLRRLQEGIAHRLETIGGRGGTRGANNCSQARSDGLPQCCDTAQRRPGGPAREAAAHRDPQHLPI